MPTKPSTRPKRRNRARERNARLRRLNEPWLKPPTAPRISTGAELDRVVLYGLDEVDISRRIVDGTLTTACDQGTAISIEVLDRDGDLTQDGLLDSQRDLRLDPMDVRAAGAWWRLQTMERTEDGWTLALENRNVAWLREERGKLAVSRARSTRAQFFARLLRAAKVDAYIPQLDDRQRIEERKAEADAGGTEEASKSSAAKAQRSTRGVGELSGVTVKRVAANAKQRRIIDGVLGEARRLKASRRAMIACIMCATQESKMGMEAQRTGNDDTGIYQQGRDWIPLNKVNDPAESTKQFLLGEKSGRGIKQRNGSIKNIKGDLNSLITRVQGSIGGYGQWESEATKTVDRWLKANGGEDTGTSSSGEKTTSRTVTKSYTYERKGGENSWTAMRRMADEVEWLLFATLDMVVYASLDELARAKPVARIDRDDPEVVDAPKWKQDARGIAQELTCSVATTKAWGLTAGMCVMVQGEGPADGRWVVFSTSRTLSTPATELTLRRTVPRKLEPAAETRTITKTVRASGGRVNRASRAGRNVIDVPGGYVYPLSAKGKLIGVPFSGTHTLGNWMSDRAIDVGVPNGTRCIAVAGGVITRINGSYAGGASRFDGYRLYLKTPGNEFAYFHLRSCSVKAGQRVKQGDALGRTGSANGVPHLHFGMLRGNPKSTFWP